MKPFYLTMNSATTLMTSRTTEGTASITRSCLFFNNRTDDVTLKVRRGRELVPRDSDLQSYGQH
jgi:hypothetical protein